VKSLGLAYRLFGEPLPLFKRLGGRFFPKNSPFQRRVEKVGLSHDEVVHGKVVGMESWLNGLERSVPPPYLLICGRLAPGPETEQGLERGHGLPAPIVAKDEFIKINLKLIAAHAVGPAGRTQCQRSSREHCRSHQKLGATGGTLR